MLGNTRKTELILYRGIYTDIEHAEFIKEHGIDNKWFLLQDKFLFNKNNINNFFVKNDLKEEDTIDNKSKQKVTYACATERDACFYALRNIDHEYAGNDDIKAAEKYTGPRNPVIIKFKADLEDIYIDAQDSFFAMAYKPEKWKDTHNYKLLCKLLTKKIVDKYLPRLIDAKSTNEINALINLMQGEDEAIMSFYKNKDILINGKRNIQLLSSFRVFSDITEKDIIEVTEMSETECSSKIYSIHPKERMDVRNFYK